MNREEILNEFLKGLRIVLNNASAYSKDHPYFRKSVEVFKQKTDALLSYLNPIKINISTDSLFVDGKKLEKSMLYTDLAAMFHRRKIKSIEIRPGFSIDELIDFLSSVALPVKEILRGGGMMNILGRQDTGHILVEELDYSLFLQDAGEEANDVWVYIFKESVRKQNPAQINEVADNFTSVISKFKPKDLWEDDELRQSLQDFLVYLKAKEKNKFNSCSKELLKHILKDKVPANNIGLDKMQIFFKDVDKNSLAEALWDQISNNDAFNYSSFQLFSSLVSEDTHKIIASNLGEKIKNTTSVKDNLAVRKKIKELFSGTDKSSVLEFYRHEVYAPLKDLSPEGSVSFAKELLPVNYFFVLLNMFDAEDEKEKLGLISKRLLGECDRLIFQKKVAYLQYLWEVLERKTSQMPHISDLPEFRKRIYVFVESECFEDEPALGMEYFINKLETSTLGADFYFQKIFNEGKINPRVLILFLKLFPADLSRFYENLKDKHTDIGFLVNVVKAIESSRSSLSLELLKQVFLCSGNVIKIEVLKSMQNLAAIDEGFLISILDKGDIFTKREALAILAKDTNLRKAALEKLFSVSSPFGRNNQIIMENLMAVEEKRVEGAEAYLTVLSKKRFFWNKHVRQKALEILRSWDVRNY